MVIKKVEWQQNYARWCAEGLNIEYNVFNKDSKGQGSSSYSSVEG